MLRLFTFCLFLGLQTLFAVDVKVPDGWTKLDTPKKLPKSVKSILKVGSSDQGAEVSISYYEKVVTMDEAVAGYIRGASRGGYQHISTSDFQRVGFSGKHLVGKFVIEGYEPT